MLEALVVIFLIIMGIVIFAILLWFVGFVAEIISRVLPDPEQLAKKIFKRP